MNQDQLQALLTKVQQGALAVPDALHRLRTLPYENLGFASLDLALAAGLTLPLLGWLGYAPGARDAHSLQALTLVYCLVPCVLKLLAAAALHYFFIQMRNGESYAT